MPPHQTQTPRPSSDEGRIIALEIRSEQHAEALDMHGATLEKHGNMLGNGAVQFEAVRKDIQTLTGAVERVAARMEQQASFDWKTEAMRAIINWAVPIMMVVILWAIVQSKVIPVIAPVPAHP